MIDYNAYGVEHHQLRTAAQMIVKVESSTEQNAL
jgi:hypothetical protein